MKNLLSLLIVLLLNSEASSAAASVRTLHVDGNRGSDKHDGLSSQTALASVQRAADLVEPGDEVVIHPGVYFEPVKFRRVGTPDKPIVFRADVIEKNRVTLTSANPPVRRGESPWTLVDDPLRVYALPYEGHPPTRLLYSGTDLYPYSTLDGLKTFTIQYEGGMPGPRHGYFHDRKAGRLYVRLHASGRCGPTDPNQHAVSLTATDAHVFYVAGDRPAHMVFEGLTFEAAGNSAIYAGPGNVTVRHCWFVGCPYAVRGIKREDTAPDRRSTDNVTIEFCDYSDNSAFADAAELVREPGLAAKYNAKRLLYFQRKTAGARGLPSGRINYETGLAACMGRGWVIRRNYLHDTFEGLCNDGMTLAEDVTITENVFARMCDNGVETESHSRNVRIHRNVFVDVFEPFSWQPGDGPPWAGPIWFYQNLIVNTPDHAAAWSRDITDHGAFKVGISLKNWQGGRLKDVPRSPLAAPAPGLLFFNNTILFPGGRLITLLGDPQVPVANVRFAYNLIATDVLTSSDPENDLQPGHFKFDHNLVASARPGSPGPGATAAGENGRLLAGSDAFGWKDAARLDFCLLPGSPALHAGGTVQGAGVTFTHVGALQGHDDWYPLRVGPNAAVTFLPQLAVDRDFNGKKRPNPPSCGAFEP